MTRPHNAWRNCNACARPVGTPTKQGATRCAADAGPSTMERMPALPTFKLGGPKRSRNFEGNANW
eukprot:3588879-Lingulodinium_polyedra.AAC.1